jgi:hypothetical protein
MAADPIEEAVEAIAEQGAHPGTVLPLVAYLVTWLGASIPAFLVAVWGVVDAWLDLRAAKRSRMAPLMGQARANLSLAVSLWFDALLYLLLGLGVVLGPLTITLTGPAALVVLYFPLMLIFRVIMLRYNRLRQERMRVRDGN